MGQNVSLPVLNQVECVYARVNTILEEDGAPPVVCTTDAAYEIQSPATVLASANTATIRDRWTKWALLTASDVGKMLACGNSELVAVVRALPNKTIILGHDNLVVNYAIIALEEQAIDELVKLGMRPIALLTLACFAHSTVLCTKPMMTRCGNTPSMMVRMCNLLNQDRIRGLFREGLIKWFDKAHTKVVFSTVVIFRYVSFTMRIVDKRKASSDKLTDG